MKYVTYPKIPLELVLVMHCWSYSDHIYTIKFNSITIRLPLLLVVVLQLVLVLLQLELAWRSGSVMDCHATAQGSIPGWNCVKLSFMSFEKDSKWGCRLKMTSLSMGRKIQPTNQSVTTTSTSHSICSPVPWTKRFIRHRRCVGWTTALVLVLIRCDDAKETKCNM